MNQVNHRRYSSVLRQTQVGLTQRTIMEAMAAVLVEQGSDSDAVKLVARRANVSERTIYRHYPSKEILWDAFLLWVSEIAGLERYPRTAEEMVEIVPAMFAQFDEHEPLLRACLAVRAWSDVWLQGRNGWKDGIEKLVKNSFGKLEPQYRDEVGAVIHLLFNGISWKTMHDQWGFTGQQGGIAVQWALKSFFDDVRRQIEDNDGKLDSARPGKRQNPKVEGSEFLEGRKPVKGRKPPENTSVPPARDHRSACA